MEFLAFLFLWIVCAIIAAAIGVRKGEGGKAFILGLLIGPIGMLIAAVSRGNRVACRFCKEMINPEAIVFRHCGKDLEPLLGGGSYGFSTFVGSDGSKKRTVIRTRISERPPGVRQGSHEP